ncbi:MAG: hypothetical protein JW939_05915, partial [Candidatus Thermoplasmatota archaeon]|nr:hypothetical protein [Candidatus Thermoplasmatota archaeon]
GTGTGMQGGTQIIDGNVEGDLGASMSEGTLIVTGDVKGELCPGAHGGTVYICGKAGSGLENVETVEMTSRDNARLAKYFDHYGISAQPATMRKYRGGVVL